MEANVVKALADAAEELRNIHCGRHYGFWREEAAPKIDAVFREAEPFSSFNQVWIQTGDGDYTKASSRYGAWAIDMLVAKHSPEEIIFAFDEEVRLNLATYEDASPLLGVQLDEDCFIDDDTTIVAEPGDDPEKISHIVPFQAMRLPAGTAILRQRFTVAPWLLGSEPAKRLAIAKEMRELYNARSSAVHSGKLSAKSHLDVAGADRLVSRRYWLYLHMELFLIGTP